MSDTAKLIEMAKKQGRDIAKLVREARAAGYLDGLEAAAKRCEAMEDENHLLRNAELLGQAAMEIRALSAQPTEETK